VLVVLPTYNEVETLSGVVAGVLAALPEASILVVDDASPDGTGALADRLAGGEPRGQVLHRAGKQGLCAAYLAGFAVAFERGARFIVEMDSDGSHLPEELPRLIEAARAGAGLVIGVRWMPGGSVVGWPWYRRWISRTGTKVARVSLRSRLHDITSGYRVFDADWLERWLGQLPPGGVAAHGYGFQVELAWGLERFGCPIAEVPITFIERRAGRSKMTFGIVFEALRLVLGWGFRLRFGKDQSSASEMTP